MFTYLSTKSPDFTVNDLAYHLEKIKRGNLVSMLKKSSVEGKNLITIGWLFYLLKAIFYTPVSSLPKLVQTIKSKS